MRKERRFLKTDGKTKNRTIGKKGKLKEGIQVERAENIKLIEELKAERTEKMKLAEELKTEQSESRKNLKRNKRKIIN